MNNLPIVVSIIALLFSMYQFANKGTKDQTSQITTMLIKLESIAEGIVELKGDVRSMRDDLNDLRERITRGEASAKQAHKRLDRMEGRETREE